jgi:hypothetical protein
MPAIRFPASAVPLLHLCKGHGESCVFRTYADLIAFLSAYGFHLVVHEGQKLITKPAFVTVPNPIDLDVFENRNLYSNLLIIALAQPDGLALAENDIMIVNMTELYAATGADYLALDCGHKAGAAILKIMTEILLGGNRETI